jgi:hypothetical protein
MIELGEYDTILHQLPPGAWWHGHLRVIVCGVLSERFS